ncbi:MAG: shikimate dehydrogenase [Methanothrix sp.]|jgi:shikimate dehydrogenase|uniref:Shikimate dehydrogenase (NADP(+)) n=1 Tax=Methanothrix harundinacea TaxID=301375 RepID=A0A101IFP1_9EURY|nr:MAG: Shikimate dehydrogenase [Methanothrix harundinacea]MDD2639049.1 shikimate dehydrogenase [Methanothrix sp.]MDD3710803.1 shikimate dehydrogenase [Methanothrix sp.]MDD5769304.1 shikimate dehydrogenase [Methanothrix sp.]MDI9398866.1 shikimate dehydrogenase [Euryarchaeota archaeon]
MLVYAVFGDPVEHSLSPAMQNAAFSAMGLSARYLAFRVRRERLRDAILGAEAMDFGGLNLTIPLKEKALKVVVPDDNAAAMGAVNTVAFKEGSILGYNTDGLGALRALEGAGVRVDGSRILIIGAGGAAKAIARQLALSRAELSIANRDRGRALALAAAVGGRGYGLPDLEKLVPEAEVVVNATSVGMKEGDPRLLDGRLFREGQAVFDIVYNRKTELLQDATRAEARVLDGVMMLVYQGALSIEIWTGRKAPVDVMEQAVREELKNR